MSSYTAPVSPTSQGRNPFGDLKGEIFGPFAAAVYRLGVNENATYFPTFLFARHLAPAHTQMSVCGIYIIIQLQKAISSDCTGGGSHSKWSNAPSARPTCGKLCLFSPHSCAARAESFRKLHAFIWVELPVCVREFRLTRLHLHSRSLSSG